MSARDRPHVACESAAPELARRRRTLPMPVVAAWTLHTGDTSPLRGGTAPRAALNPAGIGARPSLRAASTDCSVVTCEFLPVPCNFVSRRGRQEGRWVGSWATAAQGIVGTPAQYSNQTLRLIVRTSVGGNQVRIRLSNELGTQRIVIGAARIALRSVAESIDPATDRALTFGGGASITVPAGAPVLSDPVALAPSLNRPLSMCQAA